MKLIVAQGNPGPQYVTTRHNVGFLCLDAYTQQHHLVFQPKSKFNALIAEHGNGDEKVIIAKPQTFYNETGQSVLAIADFYHIVVSDILVIHDELALPFGTLRTREKGSDAGNNGIKSLNAHLGQNYSRVRIGIANDMLERIGSHDFVLAHFSKDEKEALSETIYPKVIELIGNFIADNFTLTNHVVKT